MVWISLDGLGMDEKAMLELVNRLNEKDDRKWVLSRKQCGYQSAANPYCGNPYYGNQASNIF